MNDFEKTLALYWGNDNLTKIQQAKIGIAGAGGLGSNCAFNLVRSGVRNLVITDFDVVEYANLNRQFYFSSQVGQYKALALKHNLLQINPAVKIKTAVVRLNSENTKTVFCGCNIMAEALDNASAKKMLVEELLPSAKLLVCASGLGGWGRSDEIRIHRIKDNFYIVGDLVSEVKEGVPPVSPRVNIAAAKQADIILEYILG